MWSPSHPTCDRHDDIWSNITVRFYYVLQNSRGTQASQKKSSYILIYHMFPSQVPCELFRDSLQTSINCRIRTAQGLVLGLLCRSLVMTTTHGNFWLRERGSWWNSYLGEKTIEKPKDITNNHMQLRSIPCILVAHSCRISYFSHFWLLSCRSHACTHKHDRNKRHATCPQRIQQ